MKFDELVKCPGFCVKIIVSCLLGQCSACPVSIVWQSCCWDVLTTLWSQVLLLLLQAVLETSMVLGCWARSNFMNLSDLAQYDGLQRWNLCKSWTLLPEIDLQLNLKQVICLDIALAWVSSVSPNNVNLNYKWLCAGGDLPELRKYLFCGVLCSFPCWTVPGCWKLLHETQCTQGPYNSTASACKHLSLNSMGVCRWLWLKVFDCFLAPASPCWSCACLRHRSCPGPWHWHWNHHLSQHRDYCQPECQVATTTQAT